MTHNSRRFGPSLDKLLDQVLDQREAADQRRRAKIVRLRSLSSARPAASAPSTNGAKPKPH
jgi:hypothetical protein